MPGPFGAGGTIVLAYTDGRERWELRLPVADFDPLSFLYAGGGAYVPAETGLAQTFAALGSLWAPYFDPSWALSLEAIFHQSGSTATKLASLPTVGTIQGTSGALSSANPPIKRGFSFLTPLRNVQRLRLFSVATNQVGAARVCTASSGGFDGRDQQLVAYLCSGQSGLVCWDGQPFPPSARVYEQVKLSPFEVPGPAGPAGPPGTSAGPTAAAAADDDTLPCDPCLAITPVPTITPTPGVDTGLVRCGAAATVAAWLEEYYARTRTWMNAGVATGYAFSVGRILAALQSIFVALEGTAVVGANLPTLSRIATLLWVNTVRLSLFPALRAADKTAIQRAVYCALPAGSPMGPLTNATKSEIVANLHKVESSFVALSGALVALLANVPSVAQYQQLAYDGSLDPSDVCALWDCGAHSFTGGAQFGATLRRSFTGGAQYGVALRRSMTGGVEYGVRLTRSMTGGAKTA